MNASGNSTGLITGITFATSIAGHGDNNSQPASHQSGRHVIRWLQRNNKIGQPAAESIPENKSKPNHRNISKRIIMNSADSHSRVRACNTSTSNSTKTTYSTEVPGSGNNSLHKNHLKTEHHTSLFPQRISAMAEPVVSQKSTTSNHTQEFKHRHPRESDNKDQPPVVHDLYKGALEDFYDYEDEDDNGTDYYFDHYEYDTSSCDYHEEKSLHDLKAKGKISHLSFSSICDHLSLRKSEPGKKLAIMLLGDLSVMSIDNTTQQECFKGNIGWTKLSTLRSRGRKSGKKCEFVQNTIISELGKRLGHQIKKNPNGVADRLHQTPGILISVTPVELSRVLNRANKSISSISHISVVERSPELFVNGDPRFFRPQVNTTLKKYSHSFNESYWDSKRGFLEANGARGIHKFKDPCGKALTGVETTIAHLDEGVEIKHPWFNTTKVTTLCLKSHGIESPLLQTRCRGASSSEDPAVYASSDKAHPAFHCGRYLMDESGKRTRNRTRLCWHGTATAAGAVGKYGSYSGIAKGASLISIVTDIVTRNGTNGFSDWSIAKTMDWVATHAQHYNITTLSLSIYGYNERGYLKQPCDRDIPVLELAVKNLRSQGVVTFAAAGNEGKDESDNITFTDTPQCLSDVVIVGQAEVNRKQRLPRSNAGAWVDIYAVAEQKFAQQTVKNKDLEKQPGNLMYGTGTSLATPVVSGAATILSQMLRCSNITKSKHVDAVKWSLFYIPDFNSLPKPDGMHRRQILNVTQAIENLSLIITGKVNISNLPGSGGGKPIRKAQFFYDNLRKERERYKYDKYHEQPDNQFPYGAGCFLPIALIGTAGLVIACSYKNQKHRLQAAHNQTVLRSQGIEMSLIGEFDPEIKTV